MDRRKIEPTRSAASMAIACLSGGRTRAAGSRPSWLYDFSVFRSSWMSGTQIQFSRCLRSLSGRRVWLECIISLDLGLQSGGEETYNLSSFRCDFRPLFPVRGLQRSVWFQGPVDDLDIHCRSEINLTEIHYVLVLPVLVATFRWFVIQFSATRRHL